jgi:hypothetical protein
MPSAMATTSLAPERRSPAWLARNPARPDRTITASAPSGILAGGRTRQMVGWLEDAGLLLLCALAFPLLVLIVGTPVVLVVRLLIEIGRRWL